MLYYTLLFFVPVIVWVLIAKLYFRHEFTWAEVGVQLGATGVVLLMVMFAGTASQTYDTQLINGVVTNKDIRQETCPTGWRNTTDGFCTEYRTRRVKTGRSCSGTGEHRTCHDTYKTQYKYIYPWERKYLVTADISNYEITRVDSQGVNTPPRFAEVQIGDPVTSAQSYTNYIQGAASSLLNQKNIDHIDYPYPEVTDYYHVDRVAYVNYTGDPNYIKAWNRSLSKVNSDLRKTGANVLILVTGNTQDWAESLAQSWDAHNINDVVIVVGMTGNEISWVDVRSWSREKLVNIELRDQILDLKTLDSAKINSIVAAVVKEEYVLSDMTEFEYLKDDIDVPTWALVLAFIVLLVGTPALSYVFFKNNVI